MFGFPSIAKTLSGRGICVAFVVLLVFPALGAADESSPESAMVIRVRIRAVRALGLTHPTQLKTGVVLGAAMPLPQISPALEDISEKLKALNYREYKVASSQEVLVPLMKKRTVYLHEGNMLLVRPLYADGGNIGLWLRWIDGAGTRVLDTRMHFHERETMLTGTELTGADGRVGEAATVLAIDVSAAPM